MKTKALFYLTTAGLLAACGGSNDGSAVNPTEEPAFFTVPTAINKIELEDPNDGEVIARQIGDANKGDYFEIPAATFIDEIPDGFDDVKVLLIIGDVLNDTTTYYINIPAVPDAEFLGERGVFAASSIASSLGIDEDALAVSYTNIDYDAERDIYVNSGSGANNYKSLEAGVDNADQTEYAEASIVSYAVDGQTYYSSEMFGTGGNFTSPTGSYDYSGRAAVQWDDGSKAAIGSITMSASFGATTSSANISASDLTGDGTSAAFSGTVIIDNVTGTYSSNSATMTTNGSNAEANILGIFNSDATLTAGTVFDSATTGKQAAGVFSMSRD